MFQLQCRDPLTNHWLSDPAISGGWVWGLELGWSDQVGVPTDRPPPAPDQSCCVDGSPSWRRED